MISSVRHLHKTPLFFLDNSRSWELRFSGWELSVPNLWIKRTKLSCCEVLLYAQSVDAEGVELRLAKRLLILFIALIGAANFAFFVYWYSVSEVTAIMPVSPTGYTVEALALNVTILEMILVLVGFILAALGLFGYTEIKNAAVRAAVDAAKLEAKDTVSKQLSLLEAVRSRDDSSVPEHAGDFDLGDQTTEGATLAKDE